MENSYRLTIRNAPDLSVVEREQGRDQERLDFRTCFMLWMASIAATWATIAFILSLF